ncbi:glyoxylate/hydroxypyruvate reductase A [Variovorax boronicumulans]|uniref:2-hydroxyacid dehydrogenase n=1 Tax=Variovorax boronicumulans TaxID=436515 RepID=UPI002781C535|nr:glyoxylate/hydroxypyruvate reductase A [Variovorax boronicumulans]MDQ0081569.1 glyoxylate/hydroxypyruvate reductase A [Variovorax boronicumulans]
MPCVALLSDVLDMHYLAPAFREHCPDIDLRLGSDLGPLDQIDAAVCWFPPHGLLASLPQLQLVQSLAAGVDHITADPRLPRALPLCRIVDPEMATGMKAYVCWAVIQHQRQMPAYLASAARRVWEEQPMSPPGRHRVGIAGLGTLGLACAEALAAIGYAVRGWSRSAKAELPAGVTGFHGDAQLDEFLSGCDTLVCLLPLTPQTQGFLDADLFARLPRGAHLVNVGRGAHLVEADLLRALDLGQLSAATLDAFTQEPLPAEHPFWGDPRILVTPHIATRTDTSVIARQTLHNLALVQRGERPHTAVDLDRGY